MLFNKKMNQLRTSKLSSIERAASSIGVPVNILKDWETKRFPDKSYWDRIMRTYNCTEGLFDDYTPDDTSNFPSFLFPLDYINNIKALSLTPDEQELFGLILIYNPTFISEEKNGRKHYIKNLPYEYVQKNNPYKIIQAEKELLPKIDAVYSFKFFLTDYLANNPYHVFDINCLAPKDYITLCRYFYQNNMKNSSWNENFIWIKLLKELLPLLMSIKSNNGKLLRSHANLSFMKTDMKSIRRYTEIVSEKDETYVKMTTEGETLLKWYLDNFSEKDFKYF